MTHMTHSIAAEFNAQSSGPDDPDSKIGEPPTPAQMEILVRLFQELFLSQVLVLTCLLTVCPWHRNSPRRQEA
jgi:hypothetical protein